MSAVKVVQLAIDMATRRRDEAGRALAQVQQSYGHAQAQQEQLESYAADTESKWSISSRAVSSTQVMRHYDQFMDRLRHAIVLQQGAVAHLEQDLLAARKLLLDAEVRISGLQKLLEQKQAALRKQQAAREQKQLDELSALQHLRLHAGPVPREHHEH